MQLKLIEN